MYQLIINLKTYEESSDGRAVEIAKAAKALEQEAHSRRVEIILCPQVLDIREVVAEGVKVFSQHIDNYDYGAHTGFTVPHALKEAGVGGTLISHSEHVLDLATIRKDLAAAKEFGLQSCVCARDVARARAVAEFSPEMVAVEPQELIGGDISIATARPELITESLSAVGSIPLLVGAGVKSTEDVRQSIALGAKGVLVASGVAKASSPEKSIKALLEGFPKASSP